MSPVHGATGASLCSPANLRWKSAKVCGALIVSSSRTVRSRPSARLLHPTCDRGRGRGQSRPCNGSVVLFLFCVCVRARTSLYGMVLMARPFTF